MAEEFKTLCPCCGEDFVDEGHEYDVCEICGWEDDPIQFENPDYRGGANKFSLNEAKKIYDAKSKSA